MNSGDVKGHIIPAISRKRHDTWWDVNKTRGYFVCINDGLQQFIFFEEYTELHKTMI